MFLSSVLSLVVLARLNLAGSITSVEAQERIILAEDDVLLFFSDYFVLSSVFLFFVFLSVKIVRALSIVKTSYAFIELLSLNFLRFKGSNS